jgi:hypothetical protein
MELEMSLNQCVLIEAQYVFVLQIHGRDHNDLWSGLFKNQIHV